MTACLPLWTPWGGNVWSCALRDSTSTIALLLGLDPEVMDKGIGQVGHIPTIELIWHLLAPLDFVQPTARNFGTVPGISPEGRMMARALVRHGVVKFFWGGVPNGYLFPVPKNATKASTIVQLVLFSRQHRSKPHIFCLPSVEVLAFLVLVHSMLPPPHMVHKQCVFVLFE